MKRIVSTITAAILLWLFVPGCAASVFAQSGAKCIIKSMSLSLAGDIGVEFLVDADSISQVDHFEFNGPNGKTILKTRSLEPIAKGKNKGLYNLSYSVDPTQCDDKITLCAFSKDGLCELYRPGGKQRFDDDKAVYSVKDHINNIKADSSSRETLKALVNSLDVYTQYARAYFKGGDPGLDAQLPKITARDVSQYKLTSAGAIAQNAKIKGITLLVDSKTTLRIYFDKTPAQVLLNGKTTNVKSCSSGQYIELSDIGADKLSENFTASADGLEMTFSALSYVYSVLEHEPDQTKPINKLARALYAYSEAADSYAAAISESPVIDSIKITDTDGKGTDYEFTYAGEKYTAKFTVFANGKENWRINGSYRVRNRHDMIVICNALLDIHKVHGRDMVSWRNAEDMADEWQLHNIAYDYLPEGRSKQRAADVDFDPDDQYKTFTEFVNEIMTGS